jgi:hypothetical protein
MTISPLPEFTPLVIRTCVALLSAKALPPPPPPPEPE